MHNHSIGHLNTNAVRACAVFELGRAGPLRQVPSERTRRIPEGLGHYICTLKLADASAANPVREMS